MAVGGSVGLGEYNDGMDSFFNMLETEQTQDWILDSVTLTGLDSLEKVKIFQSTEGNMTFLHQATLRQVGVVFNVTVNTKVQKPSEEINAWWSCVEETTYETSNVVITTFVNSFRHTS